MDINKIIEQFKEKQKLQHSQQIDSEKLAVIRERFAKIRAKMQEKNITAK